MARFKSSKGTITDQQINNQQDVSHFGAAKSSSTKRILGGNFGGNTLDTVRWTGTETNNGTINVAAGVLTLSSDNTVGNVAKVVSVRDGLFISGQVTTLQTGLIVQDSSTNGHRLRFGCLTSDEQNGVFIEAYNTTEDLVLIKDGVEVERINNADFNITPNASIFGGNTTVRIFYSAGRVYVKFGGNIVHNYSVDAADAIWSNGLNLPIFYKIENVDGTGSFSCSVRGSSISIFGELDTTRIGDVQFEVSDNTPIEVKGSIVIGKRPDVTYGVNPISGVDPNNTTTTPLTAGNTFTGTFTNIEGYAVINVVVKTDQMSALNGAVIEYSTDGTTSGLVRSIKTTILPNPDGVYFSIPPEASYYRIVYTNGLVDQGVFSLESVLKTTISGQSVIPLVSPLTDTTSAQISRSVISGKLLDENLATTIDYGNVELTSNKSLKTQSVHEVLFKYATPDDPALPSGSSVVIHDTLNTEANVIDTGWLPVREFKVQDFHILTDQSVKIFLLNASDNLGSNVQGKDAPVITTIANIPANIAARFFDDYFRIIVCNDSGSTVNSITARSTGGNQTVQPIDISIDQDILGFFPAPINQTVIKGKAPDDLFKPIPITGQDESNSTTTPLGVGGVYRGSWFAWSERGFVGIQTSLTSDVTGTLYIDVTNQDNPVDGDDSSVEDSFSIIYDSNLVDQPIRRITPTQSKYFRIRYINNGTAQTSFTIENQILSSAPPLVYQQLQDLPQDNNLAGLVRAVNSGKNPDDVFVNTPTTGFHSGNSTTTPLTADEEFIGDWFNVTGYSNLQFSIFADQPYNDTFYTDSAGIQGGILIEVSNDGVTPLTSFVITTNMNPPAEFLYFTPGFPYVRVKYKNNASTNQTSFSLNLIAYTAPASAPVRSIGAGLTSAGLALTTRGVIFAKQPDGDYVEVPATGSAYSYSTTNGDSALGADAVLVSDWIDADGWNSVEIWITSDVESADDGIEIERTLDANATVPAIEGAPDVFEYGAADVVNGKKVIRLAPEIDGFRIRYTNGSAAQSRFTLEVTLRTNIVELPSSEMTSQTTDRDRVVKGKNAITAPNTSREFDIIGREGEGSSLNVYINGQDSTLAPNTPSNKVESGQLSVLSSSPSIVPQPTGITVVKKLTINNIDAYKAVYVGNHSGITEFNGHIVTNTLPYSSNLGDNQIANKDLEDVYLIAESGSGSETSTPIDANTVDSNTGVTTPTNSFSSDNNYAILDNSADTYTISGFDGSLLPSGESIDIVKIRMEAKKETGAPSEVAAFVDVVGQDAGNTTSITSPTVISDSSHTYIVAVSRRDEFASVTNITNTMGFTGFELLGDTGTDSSESRTSVYRMIGTPTSDGTISVFYSQAADHNVISVTRVSGVDVDNLVGSSVTFGTNNSGGTYSGTLSSGTANGLYYNAMGFEQGAHNSATTPSGSVERFQDGSTANNDQIHNVITGSISSTGSVPFSGTCDGNANISYVALALNPAPPQDPTITLSTNKSGTTKDITANSESDDFYEFDISNEIAWSSSEINSLTVTIAGNTVGTASFELDHIYLAVTTSNTSVRVSYIWEGES